MKRILFAVFCFGLLSLEIRAGDFASDRDHNWHQWRGPLANGVAPHADPPIRWDEKTNVRWKVEIPGGGSATPIVWNDRVFVLTAIETDRTVDSLPPPVAEPPGGYKTRRPMNYYQFVILCLDRQSGRVRWRRIARQEVPHEGRHATNSFASGSPTTDGRYVYASFGSRGVYCYDLQGTFRWKRDLGDMITRFGWGEGTSPVIHGDRLIVNFDHEGDSFLAVLDAATGKTQWKVARDEVSSWSTPLLVDHGGTTQVIVSATRRAASYDLATGRLIWECGGQTVNAIPSPVANDALAICMSGFMGSAVRAIPLGSSGDLTDTDRIAWHYGRGTPYVPSPLLYGDLLYFTRSNGAILTCLSATTGEPLIEGKRLPEISSIYASPVGAAGSEDAGAAGRVYFVGRDGTAVVIKHQPTLEILAVNRLDEPIDASPAIVGRQMFLRSKRHLYCIIGSGVGSRELHSGDQAAIPDAEVPRDPQQEDVAAQ